MKYNTIGNSGLITSNIALGTMIFGEKSGRSTSKNEASRIIDQYLEAGGNHLDTADVYASGISEEIVGASLAGRRKDVIIATKVRFSTRNNVNAQGLSRLHIIEGVEDSLKRLQTDFIDLLYIHCFDPLTPLDETIRALQDLIAAGKVRYIGASNFKAWQLMKAQGLTRDLKANRFIAGQYQYSLVKRDLEYEFFDLFESEGIGLLPWGPLGGGFLSGKYDRQKPAGGRIATTPDDHEEAWVRRNTEQNWQVIDKLAEIAKRHQTTASQIAIAWILSKKTVSSVIVGVRTPEQLEDNLGANNLKLTSSDLADLDEASSLPELYPYRIIEEYGKRLLNS